MITFIINWFFYFIVLSFITKSSVISSKIISLTHAITTIVGTLYILLNENWDYDNFDVSKLWVIQFSTSYFIYDCLFMIIHSFSIMFFLHHILILIVYVVLLYYDYGVKLLMYTIFWGEITNPLQISWFLSKYLKYKKIEELLFPIFSFNFILIRSIILPYIHYNLIQTLFRTNEHYYINTIISILSILGNVGSLIWVKNIIYKLIN